MKYPFPQEVYNKLDKKTQGKLDKAFIYHVGDLKCMNVTDIEYATSFGYHRDYLQSSIDFGFELELVNHNTAFNISQRLIEIQETERKNDQIAKLTIEVEELRKLKDSIKNIKDALGE